MMTKIVEVSPSDELEMPLKDWSNGQIDIKDNTYVLKK